MKIETLRIEVHGIHEKTAYPPSFKGAPGTALVQQKTVCPCKATSPFLFFSTSGLDIASKTFDFTLYQTKSALHA